ncbi:MAG: Rpn family recombination-promoting nuclease/putative transposase [Clostridium sp.]
MSSNLLNILVDFAFKKVFAGEGDNSKYILMDFLNCILELENQERITEIVYLNPFNDRVVRKDKQSIMDIKVRTEKGELIDIEVQINDVDDYKKRSLYYWSKLYGETISIGKPYYNLKKSLVINILDFNIITENDKYHNVFVIKEKDDNFIFIEDLEIHYIELDKFKCSKDINSLNDLEEWITFLKECKPNGDIKVISELSKNKEEIGVAVRIMEKLSADELEYQEYLAREKYLLDEMSKKMYADYKMKTIKEELEVTFGKLEETNGKLEETNGKLEETNGKLEETNGKLEETSEKLQKTEEELQLAKLEKSEFVINLLSKRFKGLSDEYIKKIKKLPSEVLDQIGMDIFDLKFVEDLQKYMSL